MMVEMGKQDIPEKWEKEIEESLCKMLPQVCEANERIKKELRMAIWLGGPGKKDKMRYIRDRIRKILENENFEVIFSEDYSGFADIVSKEKQEIDTLQLAMIMAMSAGSSAEAIEFANDEDLRSKVIVFIPKEYRNGYVYRSLSERHHLIAEPTCFSLKKLKKQDTSDIAVKMLHCAIHHRLDLFRKNRTKEFA